MNVSNLKELQNINFRLPRVDNLVNNEQINPFCRLLSTPLVTSIVRQILSEIRATEEFKHGAYHDYAVIASIVEECERIFAYKQKKVINATGILIHTNLGRSPIDREVWQDVTEINTGFCNLEIDLTTGKRGQRHGLLPRLLSQWVGCEDAIVVNNNAASLFLMLSALAKDKEVIVSRGELVQIGGGFRIPDILAATGAKLVEVGTTNITHENDYLDAINENTAAILLVHKSNFTIDGFCQEPNLDNLVKNTPKHIHIMVDQGSGFCNEFDLPRERSIDTYLRKGVDLVCFSGDKLLGGPQSGLIVGRQELVTKLNKHPMFRTFRSGRLVLSLLESLLIRKLNKQSSHCVSSLNRQDEVNYLEQFAEYWNPLLSVCQLETQIGGGAAPFQTYSSMGFEFHLPGSPQDHLEQFRRMPTPIIGYISKGRFVLNVSSVLEHEMDVFCRQLNDYLVSTKWIATVQKEHCFVKLRPNQPRLPF
ncbi:L-seryl-tRNA(Sec) selenium transferase [Vibrio variabilis]|uniref:L-seryl-tRNA(Sec) selenium transferase n=1 Tax=Vibrio variabilis TaxID=990271 RepID=UPI000DD7BC82|nr:L-seryl-tRNA(Sec) selenium transferase [Vibrio variabilis]